MSEKIIQVGHSPDPDDAFMFYGIQSGKVDTEGYKIEHVIEDIETLNQRAIRGELEVSAISLHCYSYVSDQYYILPCGVSMGDDYGPVLVAKPGINLNDLKGKKIAAPGPMTTAALVSKMALPETELHHMPFDQILPAIANDEITAGILIHEGQLTYSQNKLVNLLDYGKWWKEKTGLPLPLGVDVIRRNIPAKKREVLRRILTESIQYALDHRQEALPYALEFGRGLDPGLADKFVGMYVNHYTVDFGDTGRAAVKKLLEEAYSARLISNQCKPIFSDQVPLDEN